jgi:Ca2+-binding RTX toxin-like protein
MATIVGGGTVQTSLPGPQDGPLNTAAQNAIAALGQGDTSSDILTNPKQKPGSAPGTLYVYDIKPTTGSFKLPAGAGGVVLTGSKATSITGHSGTELLIGNTGNDTINFGGGTGTVVAGNGNNKIVAGAGPHQITIGKGADTVNLTGGQDTVVSLGNKDQIHASNTNLVLTGAGAVIGTGHDTITLIGSGGKVTSAGSATVTGSGSFSFSAQGAGAGSNESVQAGSGRNTLIGGHGTNVFAAGTGFSSMVAGSGSRDTFIGGAGNSFMDADGAARVVFQFDSTSGGSFTHTIAHFAHGKDHLDLVGYDTAAAFASRHVSGGNTTITLDDGTKIVLKGFTGLKASDFS